MVRLSSPRAFYLRWWFVEKLSSSLLLCTTSFSQSHTFQYASQVSLCPLADSLSSNRERLWSPEWPTKEGIEFQVNFAKE